MVFCQFGFHFCFYGLENSQAVKFRAGGNSTSFIPIYRNTSSDGSSHQFLGAVVIFFVVAAAGIRQASCREFRGLVEAVDAHDGFLSHLASHLHVRR